MTLTLTISPIGSRLQRIACISCRLYYSTGVCPVWRLWDFAQPSPKRDIYGRPDADRTVRSGRQVANGPQKRHLRVGVDRVLDAIDLDLWPGISFRVLLLDPAHFFSVLR